MATKLTTDAELYIIKEKIESLLRESGKQESRICKAEKDIDGLGSRLRDDIAEMHKELSEDIIERTKRSNIRLFEWLKIIGGAVLGYLLAGYKGAK